VADSRKDEECYKHSYSYTPSCGTENHSWIFSATSSNVHLGMCVAFLKKRIHILNTNRYIRVRTHHYVACTVTAYTGLIILFSYIHFPMPSSLVMSLVRLNCKVLCHGNWVRVTGSFLRRSLKVVSGKFE